ncbi:CMTR2 (predicted) [Pycnogonum litorale]
MTTNEKRKISFMERKMETEAKRKKSPYDEIRKYVDSERAPERLFTRIFLFERVACMNLPHFIDSDKPWDVPKLLKYKASLNRIKDELSDKNLGTWHQHTTKTNLAAGILPKIKKDIKPDLLTQAWCKFYEIVGKFSGLTKDHCNKNQFRSVHLCEAPGAFITSLNHFLCLRYPKYDWKWMGNSLNPYYEGTNYNDIITDDRLICQTMDDWCFGYDNTGDILNFENVEHIVSEAHKMGQINLVTADGSIDCTSNPAEQEKTVSKLHWVEVILAVLILREDIKDSDGGSLVVKMFTFFETSSVCLLYFLNYLFNEVSVFKPGTSKSGNSEVYVICEKIIKENVPEVSELHDMLKDILDDKLPVFAKDDVPTEFTDQVIRCVEQFHDLQISTIRFNQYLFDEDTMYTFRSYLLSCKDACCDEFFRRYKVRWLPEEMSIMRQNYLCRSYIDLSRSSMNMSFNDRSNVDKFKKNITEMNETLMQKSKDTDIVFERTNSVKVKSDVIRGPSYKSIEISQFCTPYLLNMISDCERYNLIKVSNDGKFTFNEKEVDKLSRFIYRKNPMNIVNVTHELTDLPSMIQRLLLDRHNDAEVIVCKLEDVDVRNDNTNTFVIEMLTSRLINDPTLCYNFLQDVLKVIGKCMADDQKYATDDHKCATDDQKCVTDDQKWAAIDQQYAANDQQCAADDNILLVADETLSRFAVGFIYLLSTLFSKVMFIPFEDDLSFERVSFILFNGWNADEELRSIALNVVRKASEVIQQLIDSSQTKDKRLTVVQIVPILQLLEDFKFCSFLSKNNDARLITKLSNSLKEDLT